MGRHKRTGFTVIEVVLVIAITGLLMMGIMGNAFRQVNDQNYRDGVESFKDIIAGQLEDIDALKNDQSNGCNTPLSLPAGMGECFYSGKLLRISYDPSKDASMITSNPVQSTVTDGTSGKEVGSVKQVVDANAVQVAVPWGVQVRSAGLGGSRLEDFYILIYRDPITGVATTRFFTDSVNTTPDKLKTMALGLTPPVATEITSDYLFCLADPNNDVRERWLSVKMARGIPSASSLTMMGGGKCA